MTKKVIQPFLWLLLRFCGCCWATAGRIRQTLWTGFWRAITSSSGLLQKCEDILQKCEVIAALKIFTWKLVIWKYHWTLHTSPRISGNWCSEAKFLLLRRNEIIERSWCSAILTGSFELHRASLTHVAYACGPQWSSSKSGQCCFSCYASPFLHPSIVLAPSDTNNTQLSSVACRLVNDSTIVMVVEVVFADCSGFQWRVRSSQFLDKTLTNVNASILLRNISCFINLQRKKWCETNIIRVNFHLICIHRFGKCMRCDVWVMVFNWLRVILGDMSRLCIC